MTALLSLALGIGATTAIYSLADQVILHALPVREPERLVLIDWHGEQANVNVFGTYNLLSYPLCRDLNAQKRFFEGVLCRAARTVALSTGAESRPAAAEIVSGTYFAVLGVRPALGRVLTPDDDRVPGASPVVVLSHDFWETRLGSAPDVVGRKVLVNTNPMTVVGVAAQASAASTWARCPRFGSPRRCRRRRYPGSTTCSIAACCGCRCSVGCGRR